MLTHQIKKIFFIGIGGSGMSALAYYLKKTGKQVAGSDRQFNDGATPQIYKIFDKQGIQCYPQDGSGIDAQTELLIVSTAVENDNIELQKAKSMRIPVMHRSELLAEICNTKRTIAVSGTSGKSTTCGMIYHILRTNNLSPSLINGAPIVNISDENTPGNAFVGDGEWLIIEADESDGTLVKYKPDTGIILNIENDHKEIKELIDIFDVFSKNCVLKLIVNRDNELASSFSTNKQNDFGYEKDAGFKAGGFRQTGMHIFFSVNEVHFEIPIPGKHNMENALAAVAASFFAGVSIRQSANTLKSFRGIQRRHQIIGINQAGITVIDDFAHNPVKIVASIKALQNEGNRIIAFFQPHGFSPLRMFLEEYVTRISQILRDNDQFWVSEIFFAGGTVQKVVSGEDLSEKLRSKGKNAYFIRDKYQFPEHLKKRLQPKDIVLIMGARDPNLSDFARFVFKHI
jgi:UDP-N-acetylmuramate--alanine ligase